MMLPRCYRYGQLLVLSLVIGCASPFASLQPPHVTVTDLKVAKITLLEQRYLVELRVQNPNAVTLPISGMEFTLYINDLELARGVSRQEVILPAYGEKPLSVEVTSSLFKMVDQVMALEQIGGKGVNYRVTGQVSVQGVARRYPFTYQGQLAGKRGP